MTDPVEPAPRRRRSLPKALLVEARPKQWAKNVLVFAAPGAAGVLNEGGLLLKTCLAFVAFTLAAVGTYYLNDAADIDADRLHPRKRFRPIAAGEIDLGLARIVGAAAVVAALALGFAVNWHLGVVVAVYLANTTAYSLWLKHQPVFDVVGVAAGFVLRTIAGASAIRVPISNWFFIVACFGSLFMVIGKRRSEIGELGELAASTRSTLGTYSTTFLDQMLAMTTAVVLVGYCLWAFEKADTASDGSMAAMLFQLSIVPFGLAILRYALLVDTGKGGAPEDVVLSDRVVQLMAGLWILMFAAAIYIT